MREVENYADVLVTGPDEEVSEYVNWLKHSGEYVYSSGVNRREEALQRTPFVFTRPIQDHLFWNFSSSNLKYRIALYERIQPDVFKFRVNYMIHYGVHHIADGSSFELRDDQFENGVYSELVHLFQPLPQEILKVCPHLKVKVTWGSYYVDTRYRDEDAECVE